MELVRIDELARVLGVSPKTLANRVYAGDIPAIRLLAGGLRLHPLVALGVRAGLGRDELAQVAQLCEQHSDREQRAAAVHAYIDTAQAKAAARPRRRRVSA